VYTRKRLRIIKRPVSLLAFFFSLLNNTFSYKMAGFKLEVPVDLSEQTTDKLDLTKKIIHLISGATTLLTISIVAPLIATEARYLVRRQ
jgi:hypothetical protein